MRSPRHSYPNCLRSLLFFAMSCALLGASLPASAQEGTSEAAAATATRAPLSQEQLDALKRRFDALCTKGDLARTRVGVHVVDLGTGQTLYGHDAAALYNPASNMKLMTSAAALDLFGPAHTFSTTVLAEKRSGDTIPGDLYVQGTGEGFLLYEDVLDWAATIKNLGVTTVEGGVVVGDGPFTEGGYLPPGFEQKQEDASYRAPVGAVSINFNATTLIVSPGKSAGSPAILTLDPPNDHVTISGSVSTVAGSKQIISAESITLDGGRGTELRVSGSIGASASSWSTRKRIDNPPLYAAAVFKRALHDLGVEVKGESKQGEAPRSATLKLVSHSSEPLTYLIMAMNKWSNNFMAEQLLRALGASKRAAEARGSWQGGVAVLAAFLSDVGLTANEDFQIKNGSGLYAGNGLSPQGITRLLAHMYTHRWGAEYVASLAIGGLDGTLAGRFKSDAGMIRAKTGTLNEVTALSGYVTTRSGRTLAVAILFNDPPVFAWRLRAEQDAIAQALIDLDI